MTSKITAFVEATQEGATARDTDLDPGKFESKFTVPGSDTPPERDPDIITWDSAKDPRRPTNWAFRLKVANVAAISFLTFLTPLASSMVAPAVPLIMKEFQLDVEGTISAFVVSVYLLGYAFGPLLIAPISEVYGRFWVYTVNNLLFVVWNIACALAPNISSLLAFRFFAGVAGSCPLTIGGGSIADLFIQEQRGSAISIYSAGPVFGPVMGPIAGGYLAQAKGWRWIFWLLAIGAGGSTIISAFVLKETYEPVLLERVAESQRQATGNSKLQSALAPSISRKQFFLRAIIRPTKMLILSPIVLLLSLYTALIYGYLYLLFTTITVVFQNNYGFDSGTVGLAFLGIGIGSFTSMVCFGLISDRVLKYLAQKSGEMKPEYRLPPVILGSILIPVGLFWYGWSVEADTHWIVPIVGTGWIGFGNLACMMAISVYLVDTFTINAASALAANAILRSLLGAFLPLAGPKMYQALGIGWGNSLLGFIGLAAVPITWGFYRYGEMIRKKYWIEL